MADFDLTYCANVFSRDDYKLYDRMIRYDSWPEGPHLPARVPPGLKAGASTVVPLTRHHFLRETQSSDQCTSIGIRGRSCMEATLSIEAGKFAIERSFTMRTMLADSGPVWRCGLL